MRPLHRQYFPARIQSVSIFNRHLMEFVRFFLDPVNCLVRAGELADPAELPAIEFLQPAVGAALGTVKFRNGYPFAVEPFAFPEDLVRADLCTEIAALAPGLVNGEFHGKYPNSICNRCSEKNLFFIPVIQNAIMASCTGQIPLLRVC